MWIADPICAFIISVLILLSVFPLVRHSSRVLLHYVPEGKESLWQSVKEVICAMEGVRGIASPQFFVYTGATFGVKYTTLSNSGFLCALAVMFVPIFEFLFFRKKPERKIVFAVTVSLIGIMLLTLEDDFSINIANLKGDMLCIMCAVAYAIDLIITDRAVAKPEVNAYQLGVFQLGVTGTLMLIMAVIFEKPHLPETAEVWQSIIFLSIFCTGIAFIVQAVAQQYTTASHVGIIFTLEPVFAGIVAFFLAGEVLTVKAYIGAALMIGALFITEIDFSGIKKLKGSDK